MPTLDNSQQAVQQTQQTYQQTVEKSTSYQQSTTTNSVQVQPAQNNNNVKPVSILKQTLPTMPTVAPSENNLKPQPSAPETYSPGPGQQVTAPRRGKGELKQQQPGMRTPICGACDGQIRLGILTRVNPKPGLSCAELINA